VAVLAVAVLAVAVLGAAVLAAAVLDAPRLASPSTDTAASPIFQAVLLILIRPCCGVARCVLSVES
jgi:hypothetical protein